MHIFICNRTINSDNVAETYWIKESALAVNYIHPICGETGFVLDAENGTLFQLALKQANERQYGNTETD
jgi:hypothetical protein